MVGSRWASNTVCRPCSLCRQAAAAASRMPMPFCGCKSGPFLSSPPSLPTLNHSWKAECGATSSRLAAVPGAMPSLHTASRTGQGGHAVSSSGRPWQGGYANVSHGRQQQTTIQAPQQAIAAHCRSVPQVFRPVQPQQHRIVFALQLKVAQQRPRGRAQPQRGDHHNQQGGCFYRGHARLPRLVRPRQVDDCKQQAGPGRQVGGEGGC